MSQCAVSYSLYVGVFCQATELTIVITEIMSYKFHLFHDRICLMPEITEKLRSLNLNSFTETEKLFSE